ncbi:MAG: cupin domain-containing protein [Maritimibacter sp.]|nr:cupin domain-containing protein [Maritimibacter sp.]
MPYPAFIEAFPALDMPLPDTAVRTHALRSDAGLVVFFEFLEDVTLPPHSHLAQWGILVAGEVSLTIDGIRTTYRPGETWDLAAGVVHAVEIKAGSRAIDVFEEPDRYKLRP